MKISFFQSKCMMSQELLKSSASFPQIFLRGENDLLGKDQDESVFFSTFLWMWLSYLSFEIKPKCKLFLEFSAFATAQSK